MSSYGRLALLVVLSIGATRCGLGPYPKVPRRPVAQQDGGARSGTRTAHEREETPEPEKRYGPAVYPLPVGCGPKGVLYSCNPVDNAGCNANKAEVCDADERDFFACYRDSDNAAEGAHCDDDQGPSCAGGLSCDHDEKKAAGTCRRFCCGAANCSKGARCEAFDPSRGSLGVCKTP